MRLDRVMGLLTSSPRHHYFGPERQCQRLEAITRPGCFLALKQETIFEIGNNQLSTPPPKQSFHGYKSHRGRIRHVVMLQITGTYSTQSLRRMVRVTVDGVVLMAPLPLVNNTQRHVSN